ncbi:MAG TPA: peptidylprolyl isomerase [Flavisolibacter sp.]|nr:peptidylprolyl isomerase [Flavisolibacter sp.]
MSVIQKIRDKYARWAVVAIALSLVGFIMMDAFAGKGSMFNSGRSNTLGKVNGTAINYTDFEKQMQILGAGTPEEQRAGLIQNLWDFDVNNILIADEAEKLGLTVTDKEMRDVLYGNNPPQFLAQIFTDRTTGRFDAITAQQQVNQVLKKGAPGQQDYDYITTNIDLIKNQHLSSKYMTLMTNSLYFPKWYLEKRNVDNSLVGKMSFVMVPFASVPDSTIKISDGEIKDFLKKHEDDYKREKETRSIEYVLFSTAPSASDSAAVRTEIEALKPDFAAATDASAFVRQNSSIPFDNAYHGKSAIQVPSKDSIFATRVGGVYGPYLDGSNYMLAKVVDVKNLPDSVKCRHILLGTIDPQTGQPLMPDSVAHAKADSIAGAIRNGASFNLLDSLYSTDQVAKQDKGVMTFSSTDIQSPNFAKEFGQFILFDGRPGDKKVVKTQFGWHYIEIMNFINVEPHYKVAYVAKPIVASQETDNQVHNLAAMFAGDSRDYKSFNDNYEKTVKSKGYVKQVAPDLDEMQFNLMGVNGSARQFIKKVFETDKGDIIGPEMLPDNYVVAVVTDITKPGLPSVASVRAMVEPLLRNKKKGEAIVKNIGQVSSLEQVASKTGQTVQTADSLRFNGGSAFGYEPKVLGAVFNPANNGKLVAQPLVGTNGVYVINVEGQSTTPVETANIDEQRKQLEMQMRQQIMQQMQYGMNPILDPLKKSAKIKDNRATFY